MMSIGYAIGYAGCAILGWMFIKWIIKKWKEQEHGTDIHQD